MKCGCVDKQSKQNATSNSKLVYNYFSDLFMFIGQLKGWFNGWQDGWMISRWVVFGLEVYRWLLDGNSTIILFDCFFKINYVHYLLFFGFWLKGKWFCGGRWLGGGLVVAGWLVVFGSVVC